MRTKSAVTNFLTVSSRRFISSSKSNGSKYKYGSTLNANIYMAASYVNNMAEKLTVAYAASVACLPSKLTANYRNVLNMLSSAQLVAPITPPIKQAVAVAVAADCVTSKETKKAAPTQLSAAATGGEQVKSPQTQTQPHQAIHLRGGTKAPILIPKVGIPKSGITNSFVSVIGSGNSSDMSHLSVEERAIVLCDSIERASSSLVKSLHISELFRLLYEHPHVRHTIYTRQTTITRHLLRLRRDAHSRNNKQLCSSVNECLALLGHIDMTAIKHRHVNILSLDGGGAKGFVAIEILKNIEKACNKPIYEIFDYVCGVSTGAIIALLLCVYKLPLSECERYYKLFIKQIFSRGQLAGISNLITNYGYYDTQIWETMLKETMGDTLVINSAKDEKAPKISIVTNLTTANQMKIFLYRNYNLPSWAQSHYDGSSRCKVWEVARASSAAPGYYEDFKLDGYVFHDGGLLANNPTAIAIHEASQLWPSSKSNCVVSIGNGRYGNGYVSTKAASLSLKQKISRIVTGIGCTENVHTMLLDLLPSKQYFRFNPYMNEEFNLDENRPEKWEMMQYEANMYMRRNKYKLKMAAHQLLMPKTHLQNLTNMMRKVL